MDDLRDLTTWLEKRHSVGLYFYFNYLVKNIRVSQAKNPLQATVFFSLEGFILKIKSEDSNIAFKIVSGR